MPELRRVQLTLIDEPDTPARAAMDDGKLHDLMESITRLGLLQPIGLKPKGDRWEIEFGHRRFVASRTLGFMDIMALCYAEGEMVQGAAMLAENIEREELSAAEEALLFAQAREQFGLDEAGLIARFRKNADYIGDRLRLLQGNDQVFAALLEKRINFTVARELNKCDRTDMCEYFLGLATQHDASGRSVAKWVSDWRATLVPGAQQEPAPAASAEHAQPEQHPVSCYFCGGHKDPYNLESVYVHKWELQRLRDLLAAAAG